MSGFFLLITTHLSLFKYGLLYLFNEAGLKVSNLDIISIALLPTIILRLYFNSIVFFLELNIVIDTIMMDPETIDAP